MPRPTLNILLGPKPDQLEQRAASELQRYVRELFDFKPRLVRRLPKSGHVMVLGTRSSNPMLRETRKLGSQDYAIRNLSSKRLEICGGSPVALLWGTYEVIAQWGVTYLVQGDVMPEPKKVGPFRLPRLDVVRRPVFEQRTFRIVNDMLNSGVLWSLKDNEQLFDQLVKLRFNSVYATTYPHQPWCNWSFRDVKYEAADLVYGFRHVIHERSIGREVIGRLGHYTNPDLQGANTFEERLVRCKRLMHGLIDAAHARGLKFILGHIVNDFPEEFKRALPRWSRGQRIPQSTMEAGQYSTLGLFEDTGNCRFGHYMTPLNPVFVDMAESWLAALLTEYPQIDGVFLSPSEFPPGAGGLAQCWDALSRRHHLKGKAGLKEIERRAAGQSVGLQKGRGLREAQGMVMTVRLLDLLLNERTRITKLLGPHKKIYSTSLTDALLPVIPHVFGSGRLEFVRAGDYLTAHAAAHVDRLAPIKDSGLGIHLSTTINDDNTGFLPQFTTSALHVMVKGMRKYGVKGYWFRQFDISEYEPVMAYLIEAGWDRTMTPRKAYTNLVSRICGEAAVKPVVKAFNRLEATLEDADRVIGTGFMMPRLMQKFWIEPERIKACDSTWRKLIKEYAAIEPYLETGLKLSEPRGKSFVSSMLGFVQFAGLFLESACAVGQARVQFDAAQALKPTTENGKFDVSKYNRIMRQSAETLGDAVTALEKATRIWADTVRDPTDIGSLVGLNAYGLDWLRGKADDVRIQSEHWGFEI